MILTEQERTWTEDCLARLRLVQADASELPAEKRREFLKEEISRKLNDLPRLSHKKNLQALLEQVPVHGLVQWGIEQKPQTEREPETFAHVLDRFLKHVETAPEKQKAEARRKLTEAGLLPEEQGGLPEESLQKLRKALGVPEDKTCLPARVAEMAGILAEVVCKVDQAAMASLKKLSPQNPALRLESMRKIFAQFVVADQPASAPSTRAFEAVTGAIFAALLEGGEEFGRTYLERMTPETIWQVVKGGAKFWENKKKLAWDQYRVLASDYSTSEQINQKIKKAMRDHIESSLTSPG
jgi:hypothetical protein